MAPYNQASYKDHLFASSVIYSVVNSIETLNERLGSTAALWQQRVADRRTLARMSDHMLADIGLSRTEVLREVNKPFWRG